MYKLHICSLVIANLNNRWKFQASMIRLIFEL